MLSASTCHTLCPLAIIERPGPDQRQAPLNGESGWPYVTARRFVIQPIPPMVANPVEKITRLPGSGISLT